MNNKWIFIIILQEGAREGGADWRQHAPQIQAAPEWRRGHRLCAQWEGKTTHLAQRLMPDTESAYRSILIKETTTRYFNGKFCGEPKLTIMAVKETGVWLYNG